MAYYFIYRWLPPIAFALGTYSGWQIRKTQLGRFVFWFFALSLLGQAIHLTNGALMPRNPRVELIWLYNTIAWVNLAINQLAAISLAGGCYVVVRNSSRERA